MQSIIKKSFFSNLSIIIATLIALCSSMPYFIWPILKVKVLLLGVFLLFRFFLLERYTLSVNKLPLYICLLLCLYLYSFHASSIGEVFSTFFTRFFPLLFVLLFSTVEKRFFLKYVTNMYAVIVLISLFFFILWFAGINLPSTMLYTHPNSFYSQFISYYFFIIKGDLGIFTRFQSIFTEPGHLGMIMALLLYINSYNYRKWQCWLFLISLLWSFSLAAYILFVIGFVIYKIAISKKIVAAIMKTMLFVFLLITMSISFYLVYPDTLFSTLILSRMELDKEQGISGNNRNDASFMKYYKEFQHKNTYFWGIGAQKYSELPFTGGNSSYRVFIVQYGLIGILLLLLFGISIVGICPSKLYWGILLLYCFSFYQRPYALWEVESFSFICFSGAITNQVKIGKDKYKCSPNDVLS